MKRAGQHRTRHEGAGTGLWLLQGRHRGPAFHAPRPLQPAHQRGARPPQLIGVGIDEETALLVRADGQWEVLGNCYVKILTPAARRSWTTRGPWPRPPTSACMCCPRAGCSTRAAAGGIPGGEHPLSVRPTTLRYTPRRVVGSSSSTLPMRPRIVRVRPPDTPSRAFSQTVWARAASRPGGRRRWEVSWAALS